MANMLPPDVRGPTVAGHDAPPMMPWLANWIGLNSAEARWSSMRRCWIVYLTKHANPVWEACYPDYSMREWLQAVKDTSKSRYSRDVWDLS